MKRGQKRKGADKVACFGYSPKFYETRNQEDSPRKHHRRESRLCVGLAEILNSYLDRVKEMPASSKPAGKVDYSHTESKFSLPRKAESCVIVSLSGPTGREFDSLQINTRRIDRRAPCGVFIFGDPFTHSAEVTSMVAPCGKPSGLPFPCVRSVNPHGVNHPLTGAGDFRTQTQGVSL